MSLTPDQLPDDIAELKRLLVARDAELAVSTAELTAAKNGLSWEKFRLAGQIASKAALTISLCYGTSVSP